MATQWIEPLHWENTGTAPSDTLKTTGFKAGDKPPADIFNYQWHKTEECIMQLQEEIDTKIGDKKIATEDYVKSYVEETILGGAW